MADNPNNSNQTNVQTKPSKKRTLNACNRCRKSHVSCSDEEICSYCSYLKVDCVRTPSQKCGRKKTIRKNIKKNIKKDIQEVKTNAFTKKDNQIKIKFNLPVYILPLHLDPNIRIAIGNLTKNISDFEEIQMMVNHINLKKPLRRIF